MAVADKTERDENEEVNNYLKNQHINKTKERGQERFCGLEKGRDLTCFKEGRR